MLIFVRELDSESHTKVTICEITARLRQTMGTAKDLDLWLLFSRLVKLLLQVVQENFGI